MKQKQTNKKKGEGGRKQKKEKSSFSKTEVKLFSGCLTI